MIELVSFLGNPGKEYETTRHNLPWLVANEITQRESLLWQQKFKGAYAKIMRDHSIAYLHKPLTFMNLSGRSVREIMAFFKLSADNLLVVHDDVETALGKIGFKLGGGLGGHNGLRSIVSALGTKDFYRLRIGVGRPPKGPVSSYVLARLTVQQIETFQPVLLSAADIIENLIENSGSIEKYLESSPW